MKSQSTTKTTFHLYRSFAGLDTSTSDVAMEVPEAQPFVEMDNLWCSPKGYLSNERPLSKVGDETDAVSHVRFFASRPTAVAYAARTLGYTDLRDLENATRAEDRWARDAAVASCIFNRKAIFTSSGKTPQMFDGYSWSKLSSSDATAGPAFCCAVSNRLVLAGYAQNPTEVIVSRVNREDVLASDEAAGETSAIKAFRFNVGNLLGSADFITGVAAFERNKLAIFTNDLTLVYVAAADYNGWAIDDKVSINVGTISHNTIAAVGDEVFFCSRSGVHSLRRSATNGSTVFTLPLSEPVEQAYRRLVAAVPNPKSISAMFDRTNGRYTVFFPINDNTAYRLSIDISARAREGASSVGLWAQSGYAGLTCGDSLAGNTAFGSVAGLMTLDAEYTEAAARGAGAASTPILWHGDILAPKQSHSMVLYASGAGRVVISATSEAGRDLGEVVFELAAKDEAGAIGPPLASQFERPFQHSYSGLRLRVKIEAGSEQVRIFAIGIRLREK